MNKTVQHRIALILAAVGLLAFATVLYLAFFFPRIVAVWKQEGQALSLTEQIAVELSVLCKSYGLILVPILLAGIVACVLWTVISGRRGSQNH